MDAWTTDQTASASFTQTNGGNATFTATTHVVPQNQVVQLSMLKVPAFAALASQVGPGGSMSYIAIEVDGIATSSSSFGNDLILAARATGPAASTTDLSIGALTYGWPFGSNVSPIFYSLAIYTVPVTGDNGGTATFNAALATFDSLSASALRNTDVAPALSPVTNIQANGQSMSSHLMGIGVNPRITWTPGSIGTPTAYWVETFEVATQATSTTLNLVGVLTTTGTSVVMPPYIFQSGHRYVIDVLAESVPRTDVPHAPFKSTLPFRYADAVTASFTP
jgi:hypothetical protein